MSALRAAIEHTEVATGLSFEALVERFEQTLNHWQPATAEAFVKSKAPWAEVEKEATRVGGVHGLMIIAAINQGVLTSLSGKVKKTRLYLVGNPAIASGILDIDPRAGFYVPFRVALYDKGDAAGAYLSYDRPGSFLATLGHPELADVGAMLDAKIDNVAEAVRG
jgi:uncharacterized protein (DUF302 family)